MMDEAPLFASGAFRVPLAYDAERREVRPEHARPGKFTCVDCGGTVVFRRAHQRDGHDVRAHFAHPPAAGCAFSEGEGEQHLRAKLAVFEAITARRAVQLVRRCRSCGREQSQPIPDRVARASLEHRLPSGRRADIALLGAGDEVLAVLEICETHAVDEEKRQALGSTRWCEISAQAILAGDRWPLLQDALLPFTCRPCAFRAVRPWQGGHQLEVDCPLPGANRVIAVEACAPCSFFLEARGTGVTCWGRGTR